MPRRVPSKYRPASLCSVAAACSGFSHLALALLRHALLLLALLFALLAPFLLALPLRMLCLIMLRLQIEARQRQRWGEREPAPDSSSAWLVFSDDSQTQHELIFESGPHDRNVACSVLFSLME